MKIRLGMIAFTVLIVSIPVQAALPPTTYNPLQELPKVFSSEPAGCSQGPQKIGEIETIQIETPHPYPIALMPDYPSWSYLLRYPEASYIKVHFAKFSLADGDYVIIRTPDSSRTYEYRAKGPYNSEEFWATYIPGDTAIIELFTKGNSLGGYGFKIDQYGRGYTRWEMPPLSVCGATDWKNAVCYNPSQMYTKAKAVTRLHIGANSACTGWLVGCAGHVFTNNHCIKNQADVNSTDFEFMGEGNNCNSNCDSWMGCPGTVWNGTKTFIQTDTNLDYTLIQLGGNPQDTYGYLQLRSSGPVLNEQIFIPQHPNAWGKKIAESSDQDAGGKCKVTQLNSNWCYAQDIRYNCDTAGGSSGSPVIATSDYLAIALHHCGGCPNSATPIDDIITDLGGNLPPCAVPSPCNPPSGIGNTNAVDANACADTGVNLSWSAPTNWGDNGQGTRTYEVYRNGAKIATLNANQTTYNDNTGTNGVTYTYFIRAVNGCSSTADYTSANAADIVSTAPTVSATSAVDANACADTGVNLSWSAPTNWGDNGQGTRTYEVYRNGAKIATLNANQTTYNDNTGTNGVTYTYFIRAVNGCGSTADYTSANAADNVGTAPTVGATSAGDASACSLTGINITWPPPSNWGGSPGTYTVFRDGNAVATGLTGTSYTDQPGDSSIHTYYVRATNGCGQSADYASANASDQTDTQAPTFAGIQNAVDAGTGGAINTSWNAGSDNCTGVNYNVYRGYLPGAVNWTSPVAANLGGLSYLDTGLLNGQQYCYGVRAHDANSLEETNTVVLCAVPTGCGQSSSVPCNDGIGPACPGDGFGPNLCHGDFVWDGVENDSTTKPTCTLAEWLGLQVADGTANKSLGFDETTLHGNGVFDVDATNKPTLKYKCDNGKANGLAASWFHLRRNVDPATVTQFVVRVHLYQKKAFDPGPATQWYVFAYQAGSDAIDTTINLDGSGNYYVGIPVSMTQSGCTGQNDKGNPGATVHYQDLDLSALMTRLAAAGRTNVELRISPYDGSDPQPKNGSDAMIEELELHVSTGGGGGGPVTSPTVTFPNGGEVVSGTITVTWQASTGGTGPYTYEVSVSTDGGATWTLDGTTTMTSYLLNTTMYADTTTALVRVAARDSGTPQCNNSDASDAVFTINNTLPPSPPGEPYNLMITKSGGNLNLTWAGVPGTCGGSDYAVYQGTLTAFPSYDHASLTCTTSGTTNWTIAMPAGAQLYFLVTALTSAEEGSYGRNSSGGERPSAASPCKTTANRTAC